MKRLFEFALLFALCCATGYSATPKIEFKDFPATNIFKGKTAPVDLKSDPQARRYRTQLRTQTKEGANFAGHYHVATWGCGTTCRSFAVVDCRTGKVYFKKDLPIVTAQPSEDGPELNFQVDSRLFVVRGALIEDGPFGNHYFVWDGKDLKLIRSVLQSQSTKG